MQLKVMSALALVVACSLFTVASAQNEDATTTSANSEISKVRLVSDLLSANELAKEGTKIADGIARKEVILDLETASAALQVISWRHTDDSKEIVAVVPYMKTIGGELTTKLARGLSENAPRAMNRQLASVVYKEFGRDIYWSKHLEGLPANAHGKFDRERFELTGFNNLASKRIVDVDGDMIGELVDVGLEEEAGTIVYCVIQSEDKSRRAIPLGAFVDRDPNKDWKIELEREQVMLFEPFENKTPPQSIDRGWQEYVAVRYGRNALQTETKGAINREKVIEQETKASKSGKDR